MIWLKNFAELDELGGPLTYNHYPTGWATAFNTPFKMWKRYEFNGGTSDPCVISWLEGDQGARRDPGAITATRSIGARRFSTCSASRRPRRSRDIRKASLTGSACEAVSMTRLLVSRRKTQFYAMLGLPFHSGHEGWEGGHNPSVPVGYLWGHFHEDEWELDHTDIDRQRSTTSPPSSRSSCES